MICFLLRTQRQHQELFDERGFGGVYRFLYICCVLEVSYIFQPLVE